MVTEVIQLHMTLNKLLEYQFGRKPEVQLNKSVTRSLSESVSESFSWMNSNDSNHSKHSKVLIPSMMFLFLIRSIALNFV